MVDEDDPLAQFCVPAAATVDNVPTPISYLDMSPEDLSVVREDWGLFEQIRSNPKLGDIRNEISMSRYMQTKMMSEITTLMELSRENLAISIMTMAREYGEFTDSSANDFKEALDKVLPASGLSLKHVEQFSKLLERSGKLVVQQKQIIEGCMVHVEVDTGIISKLLSHVIFPVVPPEYWPSILTQARKFAALAGGPRVISLDSQD